MVSGPGFQELLLIFVIGLLILGPERLPRVASQLGRWVGKARRTANQLRFQMEREIALADIEKKKDRRNDNSATRPADDTTSSQTATPPSEAAGEAGLASETGSADGTETPDQAPGPAGSDPAGTAKPDDQ